MNILVNHHDNVTLSSNARESEIKSNNLNAIYTK